MTWKFLKTLCSPAGIFLLAGMFLYPNALALFDDSERDLVVNILLAIPLFLLALFFTSTWGWFFVKRAVTSGSYVFIVKKLHIVSGGKCVVCHTKKERMRWTFLLFLLKEARALDASEAKKKNAGHTCSAKQFTIYILDKGGRKILLEIFADKTGLLHSVFHLRHIISLKDPIPLSLDSTPTALALLCHLEKTFAKEKGIPLPYLQEPPPP